MTNGELIKYLENELELALEMENASGGKDDWQSSKISADLTALVMECLNAATGA